MTQACTRRSGEGLAKKELMRKQCFAVCLLLLCGALAGCGAAGDTQAPVISGAHDLEILEGESVAYRKGVTVTDNDPAGAVLEIDSSGVDPETPGVYEAAYIASDPSGNSSRVTVTVTVKARPSRLAEAEALADEVLKGILTPEMGPREKTEAIYDYITGSLLYVERAERGDWVRAALEGLEDRRGDCYVYACTAKLLLTRAGIDNRDIEKDTASGVHYWNLVDIGGGWLHFDTTPRTDRPRILLWTDARLTAFSEAHGNTHDYDHDQYPGVS